MTTEALDLDTTTTLLDSLRELPHAGARGITFHDARGNTTRVTYRELWDQALRFGGGLVRRGLRPGEPVILVLPEPQEAIVAILGAIAIGCPPAPIYPPVSTQAIKPFLGYLGYVAERARARHVVVGNQVFPFVGAIPRDAETVRGVDRFASIAAGSPAEPVAPSRDDAAFLQFTSGSTAAPKGVIVTHGNLVANLAMIRTASHMDDGSVVCTWLPVYHDMGLIGTVLNAITGRLDLAVMSPRSFLRAPDLWLRAIAHHRATHTAAPNFAYGLCTRRVTSPADLDLSSMKVFICGAEPIAPETLEGFAAHFAPAGLAPEAIVPAYGLAEATLAVTFTPYGTGMQCDPVDATVLGEDRVARLPADSTHLLRIPSCGVAMPGLEVRIGTETGRTLADRALGEVQVRGPSVCPGYINDPAASEDARTPDGWLRTGDLGYLADGHLYACGRTKDLIIVRGRNVHPHDVEAVASRIAAVRTGNVVAFGSTRHGEERLVVVAESRTPDAATSIAREVTGSIHEALGVVPEEVVIVPPGTLPKTSSGKLRRAETKRGYEQGTLRAPGASTLDTIGIVLRSGLSHVINRVRP